MRLDLLALRKDVDALTKARDDARREREEGTRRLWAFGPNLLAAVVAGAISLGCSLLVWWLARPR